MKIATMMVALALSTPVFAQSERSTVAAGVEKPAERIPTDIRRTTLIVRSIENSLKLYRDVFGMKVNYDTVVQTSG